MAWEAIKATQYQRVPGGITIWDYLLKNHGYSVPCKRTGAPQGITITAVPVYLYEKGKTTADLTARHIEALDREGLIPHYFVSISSIWQVLDTADCWQRSDGRANDKTLSIAITMTDGLVPWMYNLAPMDHAAMLTAYLLHKFRLSDKDIRITKKCPVFFTSRWKDFKQKVRTQMKAL